MIIQGGHYYNPSRMARTGATGFAAVCLMGFGVVMLFPGVIMTGVAFGDDTWSDDFFSSMRVIAVVLLAIGLIVVAVASILCCVACKSAQNVDTSTSGQVGYIATGPVVTGYTPQNYNTSYQQYPPPQGQYPPQGPTQGYAPQGQYPPQGQYQPQPQAPQGQYPSSQGYPSQTYPSEGYPPSGQAGGMEKASSPPGFASPTAPPSYNDAVTQ